MYLIVSNRATAEGKEDHPPVPVIDVVEDPPVSFTDSVFGQILVDTDFPLQGLEAFSWRTGVLGEFFKPFKDSPPFLFGNLGEDLVKFLLRPFARKADLIQAAILLFF